MKDMNAVTSASARLTPPSCTEYVMPSGGIQSQRNRSEPPPRQMARPAPSVRAAMKPATSSRKVFGVTSNSRLPRSGRKIMRVGSQSVKVMRHFQWS